MGLGSMRVHTTTSTTSARSGAVLSACAAVALLTAGPASAVSAAAGSAADAAARTAGDIPAAGSVITLAVHATSVVIACNDVAYPFELFGSEQRLAGPATLEKGTTHVPLTTIAGELTGSSPELGHISATETTPAVGELTKTAGGPAVYSDTVPMNLAITVDHDPCNTGAGVGADGEPETLVTAKPARLYDGALPSFPPLGGNDVYQLQNPVDLAPAGKPDQVVAQLLQFPVAVVRYP
jgi:hypothetical protein